MMNNNIVVHVENLWLRYEENKWLLKGVNLQIGVGESVLIIGSSGSGKTSLARALSGIAGKVFGAEVRGRIEVCFKSITDIDLNELRRCIQIVNQDPYTHFFEPIPIDDLISYIEKIYKDKNKGHKLLEYILDMLKIRHVTEKPITHLSGGYLRRLAIAKALISDPQIIILDEPLMWLDDFDGISTVVDVIKMIKNLRKTLIVFEHRFLHIVNLFDNIYSLKNGILAKIDFNSSSMNISNSMEKKISVNSFNKNNNSMCENKNDVVLELRDIWFRYDKNSQWILKNVNLTACKGDTVVIYGRNSSGKSTLLRIIAGLLKPVKGSRKIYSKILYVPQIPYLFITEDDIITEVKVICRNVDKDNNCVANSVSILKKLGFDDMNIAPINLSWGQQTRLAVILSYIAGKDGIILLDEPFTGSTYLDSFNLIDLMSKLPYVTKIITLSSKDYIPLFVNAKKYLLDNGDIISFEYRDDMIFKALEITRELHK